MGNATNLGFGSSFKYEPNYFKMKRVLFALTLSLFFASCEKEPAEFNEKCPDGVYETLDGSWNWIETTGIVKEKETTNQITLNFYKDTERFTKYVNGVLDNEGYYETFEKLSQLTGKMEKFVRFINDTPSNLDSLHNLGIVICWIPPNEMIYKIECNSLFLYDDYENGKIEEFFRWNECAIKH
jgi:hypothetical protein